MLKEIIIGVVTLVLSVLLVCKVFEVAIFLGILGIIWGIIEIVAAIPKKKEVEVVK